MSFGPADLYAIAFPGERIPEGVRDALRDATSSGVITLLDVVVVRRTADNVLDVLEVEVIGDEIDVTAMELSGSGLVGDEDIDQLAAQVAPGNSALLVLLENTWARAIATAVGESGGQVLAVERFPATVVNEVGLLAGLEQAAADLP